VDIRLLMKRALDLCASAILVAHNHPSGNLVPSDEDIELTNKIKRAGDFLDIRLIDHLIVFENQYYSLADEGRI
jgi:DNA repair protein RadC